jgi:polyisoprenyl-teichoic acid--peptidoglycan teichoic acid transferase
MAPEMPSTRSAALASFLSFIVPGLGQVAAGSRRRGLLIALPALALLAVVVAIYLVNRGLLVRAALTPPVLLGIVAISLAVFVYRFWAIADAWNLSRRRNAARGGSRLGTTVSVAILAILLAATSFMHGWVAAVGWSAHQTLTTVFRPEGPQGAGIDNAAPSVIETPTSTPTPTPTLSPGATPEPTPVPTPGPTPQPKWAADGRLNVLMIGSDAGPGRWSMRADAIILVSIDIETGRVAAFSVPRYTTNVPLPEPAASAFDCRCLTEPINALYVFANQNPRLFPGGDSRGLVALSRAIEALMGVHLDGMAMVDLNGFVRLVDAIGGVTVDVPSPVYDAEYPDPNGVDTVEVYFPAGPRRMDGWEALAYARTRHQDGDMARMQRQQHVVKALQHELGCDLLGHLPDVLDVARDILWTNLPLEDVPDMLELDPGPVESHVLFDVHNPALTADDIARIQAEVANAFDGKAPPPPPEVEC